MAKEPTEGELRLAREIVEKIFSERFEALRPIEEVERQLTEEAESLRDYLVNAETRTFCMLTVSFMEDVLRRAFIKHWAIKGKQRTDDYFGSNGPLSTFSQRVLVATGLGWMTPQDQQQTSLLRKIRNEFAHNHKIKLLTEDPLVGWAESLTPAEKIWDRDEMPIYRDAYREASRETILRMRVYCNAMFLVGKLLTRSKLIGAELPPDFRAGSGFDALTGVEQAFIDHCIIHCFRSLEINRSGAEET